MRHLRLEHRFVRNVPRELEPGILYVSIDYATAVHSCCCGCGDRVITPFTPTDWRMTFDGESISLHPSVGNWNQKCQSHYVIQRGRVLEAGSWSQTQIDAERLRDKKAKAAYYGKQHVAHSHSAEQPIKDRPDTGWTLHSIWSRLRSWFSS
ncbi:hypothetical protein PVE_R2G0004 [Pseudomonas veronii 1YdBTEX2]|uniref:Uncharacterized protein n=1 Tax=Pseudomonas veronii 1YdBTEX2 TaxID=1295141 RepID=A0A1D3K6Q3_PSEVE|nr:hypothetical protein PVE_R2G0004 [Pseudomonas veronii 1YdBTEX2]